MADPYLEKLQSIIDKANLPQKTVNTIVCKHFFSGAAAYSGEYIFMTLTPVGLALQLPEKDCSILLKQGATPLQYFPKSPVKKDYVVMPSAFIDANGLLADWILRSIEFIRI